METGKTSKYLKYAIGEIILVVIGILIALSINNWNESRKENIKAISYLENIKNDLIQDTIQNNRVLKSILIVLEDTKKLLRIKDFNDKNIDSLINMIPGTYYKDAINDQTFNKLINSGITELLDSKELFDDINSYYTKYVSYYYTAINWDVEETVKEVDFFFDKSFELSSQLPEIDILNEEFFYIQSEAERKKAFVDLLLTVEARNKLRSSLYRKYRLHNAYEIINKYAIKLINQINKKLND